MLTVVPNAPRVEEVETLLLDLPTIRPHQLSMTIHTPCTFVDYLVEAKVTVENLAPRTGCWAWVPRLSWAARSTIR